MIILTRAKGKGGNLNNQSHESNNQIYCLVGQGHIHKGSPLAANEPLQQLILWGLLGRYVMRDWYWLSDDVDREFATERGNLHHLHSGEWGITEHGPVWGQYQRNAQIIELRLNC